MKPSRLRGCKIHQLHLYREVRPHPPTSVLDMTSNRIWWWGSIPGGGMWSAFSLPLPPDRLWPDVVVLFRVPSMSQIELFNHLTFELIPLEKVWTPYLYSYELNSSTTVSFWKAALAFNNLWSLIWRLTKIPKIIFFVFIVIQFFFFHLISKFWWLHSMTA